MTARINDQALKNLLASAGAASSHHEPDQAAGPLALLWAMWNLLNQKQRAKFLRGRLGRTIDMKFTPDLKFLHDESFDEAQRMNRLFSDPRVQQDLTRSSPAGGGGLEGRRGLEAGESEDETPSPLRGAPPEGEHD